MNNIVENLLATNLADERVRNFIETGLELSSQKSHPVLNYFGINYTPEKILNVKFYVAFFHRLAPREISLMLPDPSDLYEYYDHWQESDLITTNHSGCSFALKISSDSTITNYFHLRLKGRKIGEPYFGTPANIRLSLNELFQYAGVSFEYRGSERVKRLYFYLSDPFNMSRVIQRCGDPYFVQTGTLPGFIEYTEADGWCKLIHGIGNKNQLDAYLKFYSSNEILAEIQTFALSRGLMCVSPGKYEGQEVRSVYLIEAGDQIYSRNSASLRKIYQHYCE
jgi:hypothetical protein